MKARVGYQELFQAIVDKCKELGLTLNVTKVVSDLEGGAESYYDGAYLLE
jgi:hypothetical protein